ncbi:helix-turn-helix domain-containing protein [Priestia filamentosa]|uniref:helix-turn-helix domain-containing protein n=1 Tax=Priestia filamentosa TaxID=1402861 RepID=UPI002E21DCEC|nr:helix-turn-helix domain-containing protein [Priestia filamentosa]
MNVIKVEVDMEQIRQAIREEVAKAAEEFQAKHQYPPVLTMKQLQDFLNIKVTKAYELIKRQDFPVTREMGRPMVPTHMLLKWIERNTQWVSENTEYFNSRAM